MKQNMKKAVLLILISLMTSVLRAQEADTHIASLVNNEEWFALAEDLPLYSDSMQADYLHQPAIKPQQTCCQIRKRHVNET